MKRLIPTFALFALIAIACGKEASIVPVISLATSTPQPTAQVTFTPYTPPTSAPTATPVVTASPTPAPVPTATNAPAATPTQTGFPTHTPTPGGQPPDAYMRHSPSTELKGLIIYYDWPNSSGKRVSYTNQTADPTSSIAVNKGQYLSVLLTKNATPDTVAARYRTDPNRNAPAKPVAITHANPAIVQANFPSGTVWVDVFTYWGDNEVDYTFKLDVS